MDKPTWSDLYSTTEMAAALRMASARLAKHVAGSYALAEEINFAADCIEDLADKIEQAASKAEAIQTKLGAEEAEAMNRQELARQLDELEPGWFDKYVSTEQAARAHGLELVRKPSFLVGLGHPEQPPEVIEEPYEDCDCYDPFCENHGEEHDA